MSDSKQLQAEVSEDGESLSGLLVIDLSTGVRGGYCGRLFQDWGAEVVKVEIPSQSESVARSNWLHRGKQRLELDWRVTEGWVLLAQLAGSADVLITDTVVDGAEKSVGKRAEALRAGNPGLIHTAISDFGLGGPWESRPSSDLIVSALSGMCLINGVSGRMPLREPGNQTALVAALAGFMGTLAALEARTVDGLGQVVDVSALEAMVNVLSPSFLQNRYQEGGPARSESATGFLVDCLDGQVSIITSADQSWKTICEVWQLPIDAGDTRFSDNLSRRKNGAALRALLGPILMTRTRAEIFEELCLLRVPCGMLMSPAELLTDPHLRERGAFSEPQSSGAPPIPDRSFRMVASQPETVPASQVVASRAQ